jgi:hypothetical protein
MCAFDDKMASLRHRTTNDVGLVLFAIVPADGTSAAFS